MKNKELKALSRKEKEEKLSELQKELMKINGQRAVGTVPKNPGQVKTIKRTIARIRTMQLQIVEKQHQE